MRYLQAQRSLVFGSLMALALGVGGCSDPLKSLQLVTELRVLGARVEVEGEPERAAPFPGERASVEFLLAAPQAPVPAGFALQVCRSALGNIGPSRCEGPPFATLQSAEPALDPPRIDFEVPRELDLNETLRLAVLGVVCGDGAPRAGAEFEACEAGSEATRVTLEFDLPHADDVNRNPAFAAEPLLLDGQSWQSTASAESCAEGSLPELRAGSGAHALELFLAEGARDALPQPSEFDPPFESLLVSNFSTAGKLERPFSAIAPEAPLTSALEWEAPARVSAGGELVRFWFVVRDWRGGSAFLQRALCVVP